MLESSLPFFMPPRSHSFILFLAVVLLIPAFCLLTSWQRRQKEDKIAVQFAELAASRPRTVGTPEQQRALLEALSRQYPGAAPSHSVPCIRIPLCFSENGPCRPLPKVFCLFPDGLFPDGEDVQIRRHVCPASRHP